MLLDGFDDYQVVFTLPSQLSRLALSHRQSLEWVSFIQPPPAGSSGPTDLVRYLTRYVTGGPISDRRIVSADQDELTFMARQGKVQGGDAVQVPLTLSIAEFTRRWCLHIQPEQLTKTRYPGGWSNGQQSSYQARCLTAMEAAEVPLSIEALQFPPPESTESIEEEPATCRKCPNCDEAALRLTASWARPSWFDFFRHGRTSIPPWYRRSLEIDDEGFWDGCFGTGFSAWYLKNVVESAYSPKRPRPAIQPMLPGLEILAGYTLN